jgi:uncharacterized protein YjbI with pentapeptide repeats
MWQAIDARGAWLSEANVEGVNFNQAWLSGAVMPDGTRHE